jgi:hypothetical protein
VSATAAEFLARVLQDEEHQAGVLVVDGISEMTLDG